MIDRLLKRAWILLVKRQQTAMKGYRFLILYCFIFDSTMSYVLDRYNFFANFLLYSDDSRFALILFVPVFSWMKSPAPLISKNTNKLLSYIVRLMLSTFFSNSPDFSIQSIFLLLFTKSFDRRTDFLWFLVAFSCICGASSIPLVAREFKKHVTIKWKERS